MRGIHRRAVYWSALGSVLSHVFLFFLLSWWFMQRGAGSPQVLEPEREESVVFQVSTKQIQRVPVHNVGRPKKKRYIKTEPGAASEKAPEKANYFGENNTRAASETTPDLQIEGEMLGQVEEERDSVQTFESDFSDGEEVLPFDESVASSQKEPSQAVEDEAARTKYLEDVEGDLPSNKKKIAKKNVPKVDKKKEEADKKSFKTEARKTKIVGGLRLHGKNALNVENTVMGQWQGQLSRAIERKWQDNCMRYQDLIRPGVLTLGFFVAQDGSISDIRFEEEINGGEIQKAFTMRALQEAEVPPMPSELARELGGKPLELYFNFFF